MVTYNLKQLVVWCHERL